MIIGNQYTNGTYFQIFTCLTNEIQFLIRMYLTQLFIFYIFSFYRRLILISIKIIRIPIDIITISKLILYHW
jgi:hypothetical protein